MTGNNLYLDPNDPTDENSRALEGRSEAWVDDPQLNTTTISLDEYYAAFEKIEKRIQERRSMILNLTPQAESTHIVAIKSVPQINLHELESLTPIQKTVDNYEEKKYEFLQKKKELNDRVDDVNESDFKLKTQPLQEDLYSFIVVQPFSLGSLASILLFALQITVYFFSVSDAFEKDQDADVKQSTLLNVPRGVSLAIIIAQFIAIFLGVLVQDTLFTAISLVHNGFDKGVGKGSGESQNSINMDWKFWLLSNFMRLLENLIGTVIIFVLIVKSENVITLLKDFTTMTFISQLDDNIFKMAEMKFLGKQLKDLSDTVKETEYYPSNRKKLGNIKKCPNRALYFIIVLFPLYFCWAYFFLFPQFRQELVCQRIFIQIDDRYRTSLGYFTGHYRLDRTYRHSTVTDPGFFSPAYVEEVFDSEKYGKGKDGEPLLGWGGH